MQTWYLFLVWSCASGTLPGAGCWGGAVDVQGRLGEGFLGGGQGGRMTNKAGLLWGSYKKSRGRGHKSS